MADIRPKDLAPTAESPAEDDYLLLDGATQGTRKIRASGLVSIKQFSPAGDGTTNDAAAFQALFDYAFANNKMAALDGGTYLISSPVAFPDNVAYDGPMYLDGQGATILVAGDDEIFTSSVSLADPDSTDDLYTGQIVVTGITFKAATDYEGVVFNGDRLYNIFVHDCCFFRVAAAMKSNRPRFGPEGYSQSFTFTNNHFTNVRKVVDAQRAYNFTFTQNMCEGCDGGIYIYSESGDPAVSVIRIDDNLFEGGGLFVRLGAVFAGSISGNYLEGNFGFDAAALKCHIHIVRAGGGYTSGLKISNNGFFATSGQQSDTDWCDIKFSGATTEAVKPPVLIGNWSNSYCLVSPDVIQTAFGNGGSGSNPLRTRTPRLHTEAKVSFANTLQIFDSATFLAGDVHTVCELSTTAIKALGYPDQSSGGAELTLYLQQVTAGGVTVGACVAKILLVVQSWAGDVSNPNSSVYLGATLLGFAEIPAGSEFDTAVPAQFKKHFTDPALTVVANGADNYYLKLSGYAAVSNTTYGSATQIYAAPTLTMFGANAIPSAKALILGLA